MTELAVARDTCMAALNSPELIEIAAALAGRVLPRAEIERAGLEPHTSDGIGSLAGKYALKPASLARWMLLNAFLESMELIPAWPVTESVKRLWLEDASFCANATADSTLFSPENVRFRELVRIAVLRRFPAGQFHWEITGFPRSFALRTSAALWPTLFWTIGAKMRGFSPVAETHLNDRRKNKLTLTESEGLLSYYRLARSMESQPGMKALFTCSWLYCESTAVVSPRLAWLREFFAKQGAFIGSIGPASSDSGFLVGSEERRKLYEKGSYRPQMTYVLWPREDLLDWARRHPELEE